MTVRERTISSPGIGLTAVAASTAVLPIGRYRNWVTVRGRLGFFAYELSNRRAQGDLKVVRGICALLALSGTGRWRLS